MSNKETDHKRTVRNPMLIRNVIFTKQMNYWNSLYAIPHATAQILEIANGNGVRLSKIMYDGYLSHTATKEYLGILIENGLIEYLGERTFKTTEKGWISFVFMTNCPPRARLYCGHKYWRIDRSIILVTVTMGTSPDNGPGHGGAFASPHGRAYIEPAGNGYGDKWPS